MALPSLLDIVSVIILIVPGFFSFLIARSIFPSKRKKFSEFELTVYSLLYALPIIASYNAVMGISDIGSIRDSIFDYKNLGILLTFSVIWGFIPGIIARLLTRGEYVLGECWDVFWDEIGEGAYVLVYTGDGKEYKGWIQYADKSEEKTELILGDPKLILRDSNWKVIDEIEMGNALLLTEKDIRRVATIKPVE